MPTKLAAAADLVPFQAVLPAERDGSGALIVMRDASFRMMLRCGAIGFDMKSELEKSGITYAFGSLVNSLDPDFPIEIVSHAKRLDVDAYSRQFTSRQVSDRTPPQIRRLIQSHLEHFEAHVKQNNLLQREFFIAFPWKGVSGPKKKSFSDDIPLAPLFKRVFRDIEKRVNTSVPSDQDIAVAIQQLDLRAETLQSRLANMGIWSERLDDEAVHKTFYELYHPSLSERQTPSLGDYEGRLMPGFSAERAPQGRRSIATDRDIQPPTFG